MLSEKMLGVAIYKHTCETVPPVAGIDKEKKGFASII